MRVDNKYINNNISNNNNNNKVSIIRKISDESLYTAPSKKSLFIIHVKSTLQGPLFYPTLCICLYDLVYYIVALGPSTFSIT